MPDAFLIQCPTMQYTIEDIQVLFPANVLDDAHYYLDQGLVAQPDILQDGRLITSLIRQPHKRDYRVYIRIENEPGKSPLIRGECSCISRSNCSHVAAVLLRALAEEEDPRGITQSRVLRGAAPKSARDSYPDDVKQRLLYLLLPEPGISTGIALLTVSAKQLKAGGFGSLRDYQPGWVKRGRPPGFLLDVDCQLLTELDEIEPEHAPPCPAHRRGSPRRRRRAPG